ncbi:MULTISPECIES: nitrite reductase small subunit NirD [Paraburkholderia]|uniref:nitrite reductase small subunit NirD n=1 Tax=Paraburkholderia TaxID=1822464 RepID=UPI0015C52715|nr:MULTISPECIES: nitrite reductase small subunit NirD [Paraburkholderia]MCX4172530.1 nitrite reductase small subunit NirD [Paraburkholderia madseniana]MDQ6460539.1 nitrite reductase small subunit NirD [Paraburkholderia madseniana]NPT64093.1 nitrite reductase small subunit NirD [Paraburkholderia madseniana]
MNLDRLPLAWTPICPLDEIVPNTGVCALVNGEQVAVFHVSNGDADAVVYAIENYDPGSQAAVLSRGLIGNLGERLVVASPIYKHHFDLRTGECLETPAYSVSAFNARVENGQVWVAV